MENEIVISGISGRFPESDSVAEFSENLFNKVDLITEDDRRWEPGVYGLPRRMGQLKDISKFDNQFFGVHHKQAHHMDPQARMLLELTYETIVDAGYDPDVLRGKNIGVFIGNCLSESDDYFSMDPQKINGYAMTGCCRAMFANRISYAFDFKGPSFLIDTACSSGAMALHEAVQSLRSGVCEAAIVGASNLCLRPGTSLHLLKLKMLSEDGMCKSFDASCNGYCRSEAVATLFLQRADVARRKYATIVNIKANTDGFKEQGVTFPSADMQRGLMTEVYDECKLDPLKVSYVEAHGAGTSAGDPIEMSAISEIFCEGRKQPLLVGTVKSNMGHSESASGICGIVKILIGMEKGLIPPNLHFNTPNPEIKALTNGQVKVVTDPTPWEGGYAAFSCFGFGGVNVHGVFKSNPITPQLKKENDSAIPQLALYSGRTEEGVQTLFDYLDANKTSREFSALLHKSAYSSPHMKSFRGYKVLGEEAVSDIKQPSLEKRPLWYIFPGMGTQWPGMARLLMNLEVFANSIKRSADVLKPHGIDLISLFTKDTKDTSNARSVIPVFVSIAAVQVALVDILNEVGLEPDGIVGHSVGELGCAYADRCFTADQMLLAAYWRGKAVEESNLKHGAMAALGITWSQAQECCPKDIYPSCHNAEDSVTISGPKDSVKVFVDALKAENVFTREVDSCGYAFHSQYIYPAAGKLHTALKKVIPNPKPRTSRWISSSYPEDKWNNSESNIADASYFVHNLVSPVLFHEALHHVPKNAIVVEIAPHHLLQGILKRVIGPDADYIGLMKRNVDNTVHLLSSLGRLYTVGLNPDIEKLYRPVKFPVPRGTPMISPLIKWNHSETWTVAKWEKYTRQSEMIVEVNAGPEESPDHYILEHKIDGRHLYPPAGYIVLVWRAFSETKNKEMSELSVVFENVKIHRATLLSQTESTKFMVDITKVGGEFEISESGTVVCTGKVYSPEGCKYYTTKDFKPSRQVLTLNREDIYQELKLRGYEYGSSFQGVISSDIEGNEGLLKWTGEWTVFLDSMFQLLALGKIKRALYLPTRIQKLTIDPLIHSKLVEESLKEYHGLPVKHDKLTGRCFAGGVHIKNLETNIDSRQPAKQVPDLEEYHFVPYYESSILSKSAKELYECYISVCSSVSKMILELSGKNKNQITDVMNGFKEAEDALIANYLKSYTDNHVLLKSLCGIMNIATSKDLTRHVKDYVNSYLSERESDSLSQTLVNEIPLRTVIDVVIENVGSRKLKIAEITEEKTPLSSKIDELVQTFGILKINYSLAHSNMEVLDKSCLPPKVEIKSWDHKASFEFKDVDLFVLKYLCCSKKEFRSVLENALMCIKKGGFIAVLHRTRLVPAELFLSAVGETLIPTISEKDLEHIFKESNLNVICKKSDSLASTLYLLRKPIKSVLKDNVLHVSPNNYEKWVDQLKEKMIQSPDSSERIWLVAEGSNENGIVGLVNCLRQEPGGTNIRCLFSDEEIPHVAEFGLSSSFYADLVQKDLVMNVFRRGTWGSYRHIRSKEDFPKVETEHAFLNILTPGDLSSLVWIHSSLKYFTPTDKSVLCMVYYASLNNRDNLFATGKLQADTISGNLAVQDCVLGLEFSGRIKDGQRIMGVVSHNAVATTVAADPFLLWNVPDHWSLEEAATVPVAYSTAYYALIVRGNLKEGEKILIHSGSSDVGQAAIAIAFSLGCEVFTSVDTHEKREFLKKRFPRLTDRDICNSKDPFLEQYVLTATNGEGVDAVLNSLTGEKLFANLNCISKNGRFLEIGKYCSNNTQLGMALFLKNIAFHGIFLDSLFDDKNSTLQKKRQVVELVNEGIANGTVKPLNTVLFSHDQVEQAFRYNLSDRHNEKVVIKIRDEETQKKIIPTPVRFTARTRTTFNPKKSYIIIGGLGGFGLELCQWLVERGAKIVVLTSRSGITTGYQQYCINRWEQESVNIVVSKLNAVNSNEAKQLIALADKYGSIGGIFNLALVLRDAFMENQTVQSFVEVCESKAQSTKNLDLLSRELCHELDWFVCFSSVSCGRGNAGQSNYGYANSVMERICEERHKEGLPGLAIQWGVVGDVGVVKDSVGIVINGCVPQRIISCLSVLDKLLQKSNPVVSSFVPDQTTGTLSRRSTEQSILHTVANIFGIEDITSINPETSLGELGMDSLMEVEIKHYAERDWEIVLSIPELRRMKIKDLQKLQKGGENKSDTETTKVLKALNREKGMNQRTR